MVQTPIGHIVDLGPSVTLGALSALIPSDNAVAGGVTNSDAS